MQDELILNLFEIYKGRMLKYESKVSGREEEILKELGILKNSEKFEDLESFLSSLDLSYEEYINIIQSPIQLRKNINFFLHDPYGDENEDANYERFIKEIFKELIDLIGADKLKELVETDYFPDELSSLSFGYPLINIFLEYEVDLRIDPSEFLNPTFQNSNSFISIILNELKPTRILDLNIKYKSSLFGYDVKKYSGVTYSEKTQFLFKKAFEKCEIEKINLPDDTDEYEKNIRRNYNSFDIVISKTEDLFTKTKKGSITERNLIESIKCLNDNGTLLFTAPTNLTLNTKFKESLEKNKVNISAIFETNDNIIFESYNSNGIPTRDHIPLSVFLISKKRFKMIFSAKIQEKNIHFNKAVLKNYLNETKGKIPAMGTFISLDDFRGNKFHQWLDDRKKQYKKTSIKPRKLIEICEEISLIGNNDQIEDNSLFINPNGKGNSKTNIDLELEHENYFHVKLNEEVDSNYLSQYLNSKIGESTFSAYQYEGLSQDRMDIETLKNILLFLPDYKSQMEIIRSQNALQNQLNYSKETLGKLFSAEVHKDKKIIRQVKKLDNQDIGFKNWIDSLPFPIGSILLLYHNSANKEEKVNFLLRFFEAYAEFMCVILLSCFAQDNSFLISNKHEWTLNNNWIEKSSFGGWVRLFDRIKKFISKELNSTIERRRKIQNIIGTNDKSFFEFITNGQIIKILEYVNLKRNDWLGHDGLHDQNDSRLNLLNDQLNKFRERSGFIFDEFKLISPGTCSYEDGIYCFNECSNLIGGSLPFKKININSEIPLESNRLYFQFENNLKPIKLLPFITYDEIKGAVYFYSKITLSGDEIRYITHHYKKDKTDNLKRLTEDFKDILKNHF